MLLVEHEVDLSLLPVPSTSGVRVVFTFGSSSPKAHINISPKVIHIRLII